jgi:hypothetical protein
MRRSPSIPSQRICGEQEAKFFSNVLWLDEESRFL